MVIGRVGAASVRVRVVGRRRRRRRWRMWAGVRRVRRGEVVPAIVLGGGGGGGFVEMYALRGELLVMW